MHEPPTHVGDQDVLDTVRATWLPEADSVVHLPVGFGAHHWAASAAGERRLFVTLDVLGARDDADSLTSAYGAAAALAGDGLEFVHASLPPLTVPLADGLLSATPWVEGRRPERLDREATATMLARLHAAPAPDGIPHWRPLVGRDLSDDLAGRLRATWDGGPFSARAQAALRAHLPAIDFWVTRYHRLAEEAASRPGVPNPPMASPTSTTSSSPSTARSSWTGSPSVSRPPSATSGPWVRAGRWPRCSTSSGASTRSSSTPCGSSSPTPAAPTTSRRWRVWSRSSSDPSGTSRRPSRDRRHSAQRPGAGLA